MHIYHCGDGLSSEYNSDAMTQICHVSVLTPLAYHICTTSNFFFKSVFMHHKFYLCIEFTSKCSYRPTVNAMVILFISYECIS